MERLRNSFKQGANTASLPVIRYIANTIVTPCYKYILKYVRKYRIFGNSFREQTRKFKDHYLISHDTLPISPLSPPLSSTHTHTHTPFHGMENIQTEASFLIPYLEEGQRQLIQDRRIVVGLRGRETWRQESPIVCEVPRNHVMSWDEVHAQEWTIAIGPLKPQLSNSSMEKKINTWS